MSEENSRESISSEISASTDNTTVTTNKFQDIKDIERDSIKEEVESVLSTVDSNTNLNLSEYYISSDAETEKMDDIIGSNLNMNGTEDKHPKLSDLIPKENENGVSLKRNMEDIIGTETETKKVKVEEPKSEEEPETNTEEDTQKVVQDVTKVEEDVITDKVHDSEVEVEAEAEESLDDEEEEDEEEDEEEEDEEEDEEEGGDSHNEPHDLAGKKFEGKELSSKQSSMELEETRITALKEITEIEYKFADLRQKLYENKLVKLKTELQMCLEGSHPELQNYYTKIASVRDYKLRRAYNVQKYELRCIDQQTKATRTTIHQDFYKQVSTLRNQLLTETTQNWYDINKERRDMDMMVPEIKYHIPIKMAGKTLSCITGYAGPVQQRYAGEPLPEDLECEDIKFRYRTNAVDKLEVIVDRMRLNNELSDLSGLGKYYGGFPGAPDLNGLRDTEVINDLQSIRRG